MLNPRLGRKYRPTLDLLHGEGHELGLHGGTDHAAWQYGLDRLGDEGLNRLFAPAFADFRDRYGPPRGFASPGFCYNDAVLDLLDREGFEYGSDMVGEEPFRPLGRDGHSLHAHYQVPVNVVGGNQVPLVEQGLARGDSDGRIVKRACERIGARPFALMYGHPYVEGVHWKLLDAILGEMATSHEVVTVAEYLTRWKETTGDG